MPQPLDLLTSPRAAEWLVLLADASVKGTAILLATAVGVLLLRRARAGTRHVAWCLALVGAASLPVLSRIVPGWTVPWLSIVSLDALGDAALLSPRAHPTVANEEISARADFPLANDRGLTRGVAVHNDVERTGATSALAPRTSDLAASSRVTSSSVDWASTLAVLWLAGASLSLLVVLAGALSVRRLARAARPPDDERLPMLVAEVSRELRLRRSVRLLLSGDATMPSTFGVLHPVVLLPSAAAAWPDERIRLVLLHELAHVQRYDCLTQLVAQLCCAVYWFHPAVWFGARRMRAERELACDDAVLTAGANACDYAALLLDVARRFRAPAGSFVGAVAMARPRQLEGRLHAILDASGSRRERPGTRLALTGALTMLVLALAAMRPSGGPNLAKPGPTASVATSAGATPSSGRGTEVLKAVNSQPSIDRPLGAIEQSAAQTDTFRWRGRIPAGKALRVSTLVGDIRAEHAAGDEVEVIAVRRAGSTGVRMEVLEGAEDLLVCAFYPSSSRDPEHWFCTTDYQKRLETGPPMSFVIRVPAGVRFTGFAYEGNVEARGLRSPVRATTITGDISIATTEYAAASAVTGDIVARVGKADWRGLLELRTVTGDIDLTMPTSVDALVHAAAQRGRISSSFPLTLLGDGDGYTRGFARLGASRQRRLSVETMTGDIRVVRVGDDSLYTLSRSAWRGGSDTVGRGVAVDTSADPTGERVRVRIPSDIRERFSDAALRGAPDSAVIAQLREASWRAPRGEADLVTARALWALTIVRNGHVVEPLITALGDRDWRVRAYAAWALSVAQGDRSVIALIGALDDDHWRVRMHAAWGLAEAKDTRASSALIRNLADTTWQVKMGAIEALKELLEPRALEWLREIARTDDRAMVRAAADEAATVIARRRP